MQTHKIARFFIGLLGLGLAITGIISVKKPTLSRTSDSIVVLDAEVVTLAMHTNDDLEKAIHSLQPRLFVQYAEQLIYIALLQPTATSHPLPIRLQDRIFLQWVEQSEFVPLRYPHTLINDSAPPIIYDIRVQVMSGDTIILHWATDEFTHGRVDYGSVAGYYEFEAHQPLYQKTHQVILSGLQPRTRYFYRIGSVDLNDNMSQSQEHSFMISEIYLPIVVRNK